MNFFFEMVAKPCSSLLFFLMNQKWTFQKFWHYLFGKIPFINVFRAALFFFQKKMMQSRVLKSWEDISWNKVGNGFLNWLWKNIWKMLLFKSLEFCFADKKAMNTLVLLKRKLRRKLRRGLFFSPKGMLSKYLLGR